MLFTSLPPPPPSFSHDTIHSIHSLYDTSILSEIDSENLPEIANVIENSSRPLQSVSTKLETKLNPSNNTIELKSSINTNNPSRSSSNKNILDNDTYKSERNLNDSKRDTESIKILNSTVPNKKKEIISSLMNYLNAQSTPNVLQKNLEIEHHPQYQELVKENTRLRAKLERYELQFSNVHSKSSEEEVEHTKFKEILNHLALQLKAFQQDMDPNDVSPLKKPFSLWIQKFIISLNSKSFPTMEDVFEAIQNLIRNFQNQIDSIMQSTPIDSFKLHTLSHEINKKTQKSHTNEVSSFHSFTSSLSNSNASSLATGLDVNYVEPICASCLRLTHCLESQTQALSKVDCEIKNNKEKLAAMLRRIEATLLQKNPNINIATSAYETKPFLILDVFESSLLTFIQSNEEKLAKLQTELKSLSETNTIIKSEAKKSLEQYQTNLSSMEIDSKNAKSTAFQYKALYEKQTETTKKLKEKVECLKKLVHQIEQHAVDEIMKHKSTKELCEQLRLRVKSLKDSQEQYKTELSTAKEYSKKLNTAMERQSGYLRLLKNKNNIAQQDEASSRKISFEEFMQTLEATKSKLANEQRLRQRAEAKMQALQSKIEFLQKLFEEKEEALTKGAQAPKETMKRIKPEFLQGHHLVNQYKLAISDYVKWLYSSNVKLKHLKESQSSASSASFKVPKHLIDKLSNAFLHMPFDELVNGLEKARQNMPCRSLESIFSAQKNVRSLLFTFLKNCTNEVLQIQDSTLTPTTYVED